MKRSFETIQVREVMTRSPVSVRADDSLQRALDLIDKHPVHELPVLESGRCIGIVSSLVSKLLLIKICPRAYSPVRSKPAA